MVLNHPNVSRYHAVIERMGTRSRLIDLHSANGVYINGTPVKEMTWLKPGDDIKIGPYKISFTGNELKRSLAAESYKIDVLGINKWVSKTVKLIKDINISIGENEFVALVGMSGAGKSTLMDAINGFRPATDGKVLINGTDLYQNYGMFRDDIGNVPQKDIVHTELTPETALDYAAQLRMPADTSAQERKNAVNETLEDLGMTFKKDVPISRLSGGQLKRVSIGVELLTKPRLFFLDEPTSGLDPGTEYEMMKLLRRLADQGRTIMIILMPPKTSCSAIKQSSWQKAAIWPFTDRPRKHLNISTPSGHRVNDWKRIWSLMIFTVFLPTKSVEKRKIGATVSSKVNMLNIVSPSRQPNRRRLRAVSGLAGSIAANEFHR
jgi:ABC transport system ATP-binding/permease protein